MAKNLKSNSKRNRKDKVLHTRVPEALEKELRKKAERMRVPVSNLIRNILEDAFKFVDNVVSDSLSIAKSVRKDAMNIAETAKAGVRALKKQQTGKPQPTYSPSKTLSNVYGWQPIVLNLKSTCCFCRKTLGKTTRAMMGVGKPSAQPVFACKQCFKKHVS